MRYKLGSRYEDYRKKDHGILVDRKLCQYQNEDPECRECRELLVFSETEAIDEGHFCGYSEQGVSAFTEIKTEKENNVDVLKKYGITIKLMGRKNSAVENLEVTIPVRSLNEIAGRCARIGIMGESLHCLWGNGRNDLRVKSTQLKAESTSDSVLTQALKIKEEIIAALESMPDDKIWEACEI